MSKVNLIEDLKLKQIDDGYYESVHKPLRMGNMAAIAFGGFTIAIGVNAAFQTVPTGYHLYSAQGNFLGPALTDRTYVVHVHPYRQTKTFATRRVEVNQRQDDGKLRLCMVVTTDFQIAEKKSLLEYSRSPTQSYSSPTDCLPVVKLRERLVQTGDLSQTGAELHAKQFGLGASYWDSRTCPEGVAGQTLFGVAKNVRTTQDGRVTHEKTSADWFRNRQHIEGDANNVVALSWHMDAGLAFIPLVHSKKFLDDAGACSTLDFSFRVFVNDLNVNEWLFREIKTATGGSGRTFVESTVWDEKGRMVANMTQQNILRPKL